MNIVCVNGELRQIVRPLGRFGGIPNLCTACLLGQDVRPLFSPEPEERPHPNQVRNHERFAPHIGTIKRMLAEGKTFYRISKEIGIPNPTISDYVSRNKEMFEC